MDESLSPPEPVSVGRALASRPDASHHPTPGDATRAGVVQLVSSGARVLIMLGTGMLLARLLTPTDFGLYAMVSTVTALVESVRGFGLNQALVHQRDWDEMRMREVWRSLVLASAVMALLVAASSVPLSIAYGEPRLIPITLAVSIGVFCIGLPAVWEARLVRGLRFAPIARADLGALATSVAIALLLAFRGAGYWALVAQYVSYLATRALFLRVGSGPVAGTTIAAASAAAADRHVASSVRALFAYGRHVTFAQVITFAGRITDRVVIGIYAGPSILGLYDSASRWSQIAFEQVMSPLHGVILSTLNRARRTDAPLGAAVTRVLLPPMSVVVPLLGFLALETDIVVRTLLGDQWDAAVPFLRVLCGAAAGTAVIKLARIVYLVTGATKRQVRFAMLHMVSLVVAVLVGARFGPMGVAWAVFIANGCLAPLAVWNSTADSPVRATNLWRAVARPAAAVGCAAFLLAAATAPLAIDAGVGALVLRAATFGGLYALAWLLLPGGRTAARQLVAIARDVRGRRR